MAVGSVGDVLYRILAEDKTAEGLDSASNRVSTVGKIVGTAMTGIGAGMTLMTDKARRMNAPLEAMAIQLDSSSAEMRELAMNIGNVTFPLEEAISSMDLLVRAGMQDTEVIGATATAFDVLGDAIGLSASQVTTIMIPAFNAFDLELKDAAEYTDLFTHMQRNTTIELSDFSAMLKYIAPDIATLGISLEQSVAVMEALADKGIQGSSATREFRTAITQADGDLNAFYEALGLTSEEVATYTEELSEAEGMTEKYAAAMNTQYGFVDKLKYGISELTLKYGSLLQPVEALGPSMAALGPLLIVATNLSWAKVTATLAHTKALGGSIIALFTSGGALTAHAIGLKAATAAQWLMNASLYGCPLVWIVGAIAAVVAVLYVLEKKFGVVTAAVKFLSDGIKAIVGFFGNVVDAIRGVTVDTDALAEADGRLIQANKDLRDSEERVDEAEKKAAESAEDLAEISAELAAAQLAVADSAREVDELTEAYEELKGAMDKAAGLTEDLDDLDRNLRGAQLDLLEAQEKNNEAMRGGGKNSREAKEALGKYTEAVKKYGSESDEAARAQNKYDNAVSKSIVTVNEKARAALRLEEAIDRVDDLKKKIASTQEEETAAIEKAAETQKKYGDTSVKELKSNIDKNKAANKKAYEKIEELQIKAEKARKAHEYNEEDAARELLVYGNLLNKIEDIAGEKEKILKGEANATESALGKISGFFAKHGEIIITVLASLLGPIAGIVYAFRHWDEIVAKIGEVKAKIEEGMGKAISYLTNIASTIWTKGAEFVTGIVDGIVSKYHEIKNKIEEGIQQALDYLKGLPGVFFDSGVAIINGIVDGIKTLINKPAELIKGALGKVRDLLPFSDAKEGPLSDLSQSGRMMVRTFNKGMETEKSSMPGAFSAGLSPTAASGGNTTYGGNTISIGHVTLSADYPFDKMMADMEKYNSARRAQRGIRAI